MTKKDWSKRKAKKGKRAFHKPYYELAAYFEVILNDGKSLTVQQVREALCITQNRLESLAHRIRISENNFLAPVSKKWLSKLAPDDNWTDSLLGEVRQAHEKLEKTRNTRKFFVRGLEEEGLLPRRRAYLRHIITVLDAAIGNTESEIASIELMLTA